MWYSTSEAGRHIGQLLFWPILPNQNYTGIDVHVICYALILLLIPNRINVSLRRSLCFFELCLCFSVFGNSTLQQCVSLEEKKTEARGRLTVHYQPICQLAVIWTLWIFQLVLPEGLEATSQTPCCATSLPLRGPEVHPNGTTSITGLTPWKLLTLLWFRHQEPPASPHFHPSCFAVTRPLSGRKGCPPQWLNGFKLNKLCYFVSQLA